MTNPKTPFEKIRSLVERRKLFEQLVRAGGEIICKGDDDSLFTLKPEQLVNGAVLRASLAVIDKMPHSEIGAIGNFAIEGDRYFFSGPLKAQKDAAEIALQTCDVFVLQRRASLRITLRPQLGLFMAITEFEKRPCYVITHVADVSAGGARIYFGDILGGEGFAATGMSGPSHDPGLQMGSRFKAVIHPPSAKNIEVICEVKHSQKSVMNNEMITQYGIEFVEQTTGQKNRLLALTMDMQRKIALQMD